MSMMSNFKSEFPPDELLMALFVDNMCLSAKIEVLEKIAVEFYKSIGKQNPDILAALIHENNKALEKRISNHMYFSDKGKEDLKKDLIKK